MNILALDTSMGVCGAAVLLASGDAQRTVLCEESMARGHAEALMPMVAEAVAGAGIGFAEIDARNRPTVNLSYFGLVPTATGAGLGTSFLRAAIDAAWGMGARGVTVNTCTADHPRALPSYLRAGFRPVRAVREIVRATLGHAGPDLHVVGGTLS